MTEVCRNIRREILKISHETGHGHIPTCFSIVEILYAVYSLIKHDPKNPLWEERDIFLLSKGHGALAQYEVLANFGYFKMEEIYSFGLYKTKFGCHGDRHKVPGIEASTGSLGHGIGIAVGMALAFKIQKSPRKVFVLIGDGESNEGSVWEAVMVANNLNLNNLTVIYDNNCSQLRCLQLTDPEKKFNAFGCDTKQVDGHSLGEIVKILKEKSDKVRCIIANTKKGYGCRTLVENYHEWHRKSPDETNLETLLKELDEKAV